MTSAPPPAAPVARERLAFLDGLRALAALAVVAVHAFQMYGYDLGSMVSAPTPVPFGDGPLDQALILSYNVLWKWGPYAVPVFIVLSGFSLMLPVVRRADLSLSSGTLGFYRRRAWRILPPYYAALVLGILVTALVPGFNTRQGVYWDIALPTFQAEPILAHLFLVHNMPWSGDPFLGMRINPPLWSVAVEVQIYLLFPLLLILWRRLGPIWSTAIAVALGIVPTILGLPILPLSNTHYLGLFALGALGAGVAFRWPAATRRWVWLALGGFGVALFGAALAFDELPLLGAWWVADTALGLAVLGLLVHASLTERSAPARRPLYLSLLSAPPLVALGERSYSLYLIHAPVLALVAALFVGLPAALAYPLVFIVGVPACIGATLIFFAAIERRFLHGPRPKAQPAPAAQLPESQRAEAA